MENDYHHMYQCLWNKKFKRTEGHPRQRFFVWRATTKLVKGPRTLRKFLQKCQKIAGCKGWAEREKECSLLENQREDHKWSQLGCEECAVYGSRPPIASKPGSSPPERPGLDNTTSQPWSDTIFARTIGSSTLSCLFKQKECGKVEVSTWRGGTGANCVIWEKEKKGDVDGVCRASISQHSRTVRLSTSLKVFPR